MLLIGYFLKGILSFLQMQEELLTEGFKKEAEELNKEIDELKESIEVTKSGGSLNVSRILDVASIAFVAVLPGPYNVVGMGVKLLNDAFKKTDNSV